MPDTSVCGNVESNNTAWSDLSGRRGISGPRNLNVRLRRFVQVCRGCNDRVGKCLRRWWQGFDATARLFELPRDFYMGEKADPRVRNVREY